MENLISRLKNVKKTPGGYTALCPAHDDKKNSLSVSAGKEGQILLYCHAGCSVNSIVEAIDLSVKDLFRDEPKQKNDSVIYDYHDSSGKLIYQVVRSFPKNFKQRRPDDAGGWIWNMQDIEPLPYHLPALLEAIERQETVFVTEGEKDVHSLEKIGLVATTNHGGAGKWRECHSKHFSSGAGVVVIPDNDEPGRKHAESVAEQLKARGCQVRILVLPGLAEKCDVSDWLTAGHTKEELIQLVNGSSGVEEWPEPEPIESELLPVEQLPLEIIPEPFRAWLKDIAYRMQCPIDFVAAGAIVTAGSVIGAGCGIHPKQRDDWFVVPNLWGGIVAKPSKMKTPSLDEIIKPLIRLQIAAKTDHDSLLKLHEGRAKLFKIKKEAMEKEMRLIVSGKDKEKGKVASVLEEEIINRYAETEEPQAPVRRRYKTNDSTVEKLGELLSENPRGILIFRDELVGLLVSWEKEGREGDREFMLEAWKGVGPPHDSDRIGRGNTNIENVCISILGGIQPSKLQAYLQQANDPLKNDGLLQRFQLLVYPDEQIKRKYVDEYPDTEEKNRAFAVFEKLANMDFLKYGAVLPEGRKIPHFRFSAEAQKLFIDWYEDLENKLQYEELPALEEHLTKYRSLMPSLALIFHLIEIADNKITGSVSLQAAEMAAAWCDYLESHARRIYGMQTDIKMRVATELLGRIKEGALNDGFTIREVYSHHWHLLDDKEKATPAVTELVDAGYLKLGCVPIPGRQPKEVYYINPKLMEAIPNGQMVSQG